MSNLLNPAFNESNSPDLQIHLLLVDIRVVLGSLMVPLSDLHHHIANLYIHQQKCGDIERLREYHSLPFICWIDVHNQESVARHSNFGQV